MTRAVVAACCLAVLRATAAEDILKVFVLAGQSNMEGQAEVNKTCTTVEPGKCEAVGAPMNGTLVYQLSDPRTAKDFAQCWDKDTNDWTVLEDVKIWFNEKGKVPALPDCPLGCPVDLSDGSSGSMSIGFGSGGHTSMSDRTHIGPEYGFGFAMNDVLKKEKILIIKTAWGGKTLCGDFRPPSSTNVSANKSTGFYYKQMLQYVENVLSPGNLSKLFPDLSGTPKVVGFGWDQGWNDGCGEDCTKEYEQNMVNLISDLRKEWKSPDMAVSIPVSGFGGWEQTNDRRLGIMDAQFGACNTTRHPEQHNCVAEETRGYWREFANSPVNQGYHWWHNAESYWLIGQAMGKGMAKAMGGTATDLTILV